ncbi:MAG: hypothetical protein LBD02_01450 [Christensenellaceae bacterium]|jgi:N-acetylneuraminic acid mutarotase|nr:hypothetical protein [Christensenellaceae bacterium]
MANVAQGLTAIQAGREAIADAINAKDENAGASHSDSLQALATKIEGMASGSGLDIYAQVAQPEKNAGLWIKRGDVAKVISRDVFTGDGSAYGIGNLGTAVSHASCAAYGNKLYIFGGQTGAFSSTTLNNDLTIVDTITGAIEVRTGFLPSSLIAAAAITVGNKIYVLNTTTASSNNAQMYIFDPTTVALTAGEITALTFGSKGGAAAAAVGTAIYFFGGKSSSYSNTTSVSSRKEIVRYDTANDTFLLLSATLPEARICAAASAYGNNIYIFGGAATGSINSTLTGTNTIYKFDTTTSTLTTLSSVLPNAIAGMAAQTIGNKVYVFGGSSSGAAYGAIRVFDPITNGVSNAPFSLLYTLIYIETASAVIAGTVYIAGGRNSITGNGINGIIAAKIASTQLDAGTAILAINRGGAIARPKIYEDASAEIEMPIDGVYYQTPSGLIAADAAWWNGSAWAAV